MCSELYKHYFACYSDAPLERVTAVLQIENWTPPFIFDQHENWEYAWAKTDEFEINITKSDDNTTIETWMNSCPSGVNYQIIITALSVPEGLVDFLESILKSRLTQYAIV